MKSPSMQKIYAILLTFSTGNNVNSKQKLWKFKKCQLSLDYQCELFIHVKSHKRQGNNTTSLIIEAMYITSILSLKHGDENNLSH